MARISSLALSPFRSDSTTHTIENYRANGKLLLTGEYAVLDGALALAVPTKLGQRLEVEKSTHSGVIEWTSYGSEDEVWFEGQFELGTMHHLESNDPATGKRLEEIFQAIQAQQLDFLQHSNGLRFRTYLDFPREWGLGSSSTLLSLLAQYAEADPQRLLQDTFGGSGYDIACAQAEEPILYQRRGGKPQFVELHYDPPFTDALYFVYRNQKQDSRAGMRRYRAHAADSEALVAEISHLTAQVVTAATLTALEAYLDEHEQLIGEAIGMPPVKDSHFLDYWGSVKSLGAWGGDFVLVTSNRTAEATRTYFRERGYPVVLDYQQMVL